MYSTVFKKRCFYHKDTAFSFFCFDDKKILCSKCFKDHKKHSIEIIDDLKERTLFLKSLNKKGQSLIEYYLEIKTVLEKVKSEIEESLNIINQKIEELKNSTPLGEIKNIFSLTFDDYEKISTINEILKKTHVLSDTLGDLSKEIKTQHNYSNFRIISQSVEILEHSKEYPTHPLDIMLGKNNTKEYSLFDGVNHHFLVLNLGEYCLLKNIIIGVDVYDCSLKNFKVKIKNEIGKWEEVGKFVCDMKEVQNKQEFTINKETQFVRIDLIDNWGVQSGNFILIKSLAFQIADIH